MAVVAVIVVQAVRRASVAIAAAGGGGGSGGKTSILSDLIVGLVAPGQLAVRAPIRIGFGVQLGTVHPAIILY